MLISPLSPPSAAGEASQPPMTSFFSDLGLRLEPESPASSFEPDSLGDARDTGGFDEPKAVVQATMSRSRRMCAVACSSV